MNGMVSEAAGREEYGKTGVWIWESLEDNKNIPYNKHWGSYVPVRDTVDIL